ncbi:MAG TPA: hypothetical protein VK304_10100 [Thermoleophilaceae bacterium]|nr:hypothetical protein [Thermoleophilaceae bacterium]
MTLIALVLVVLVVAAGLYYNQRWWRPRQAVARLPDDGLKVGELTAPLATLTVLLLVFVLVQTYGSWAAAGRAETDEATATLLLFREVDLIRDARLRTELRKEVVCYATSVIRQDWPAMGNRRISSVPTYWGARIREHGVRLVRAPGGSTAGEQIVKRDGERASARQSRLGEARPTVPKALSWLILVAVVMVLAVLSTASMPGVGRLVQVAIVLAAAVAFVSTLLLILDLDHPYAGPLRRDPTQTEFVRNQIAAEARGPLPCHPTGLPVDAPGFRSTTSPLG